MSTSPAPAAQTLVPEALAVLLLTHCYGPRLDYAATKRERLALKILSGLGLLQLDAGKWCITERGKAHVVACCGLALSCAWDQTAEKSGN